MTISEIKSVVQQEAIPQNIQQEIISLASSNLDNEFDVEIVSDTNSITLEVYESGIRIERVKRTFARNSDTEFLMAKDAENLD